MTPSTNRHHPAFSIVARLLLIATLCVTTAACAFYRSNQNDPLYPQVIARLEPGRTTALEAVRLLGGPSQVIQLGERSAYRYDHSIMKGTALILVVFNLGHVDTREDRLWLFFDANDVLTHVGSSLGAHRAQYAMPWENIHEESDSVDADRERGLVPRGSAEETRE